ncbi:MAG: hypothetical protein HKN27_06735 [Silicimonas sp.]|nr:hypothetical protein [Silicimonas sp.]
MGIQKRISQRIRRFLGKDDGTATVEAVLWFPIFILIFGLMVDAAMIFHGQAKVLRVVQDANRNYSIGRLRTEAETQAYVVQTLANLNIAAEALTIENAGVATTIVKIPASELQILGYFTALNNLEILVTADHLIENWEV